MRGRDVTTGQRVVAYYRVSTDKQGRSGLGLEAQQRAVRDSVMAAAGQLVAEFMEVESGKRSDRPQLAAALAACRKHRAVLCIAKLDRLARNVAFIANLMDAGVDFVAVDMPNANRLTLHVMAAFAEHEREATSARTKAALAAARARGVRLGAPDPIRAGAIGRARQRISAARFAANVLPIVEEIRRAGAGTLAGIAGALNARGVPTARGGQWHAATVRNLLLRAL
jgi:DNA invertase Pin-like site-specific DNA recombinase